MKKILVYTGEGVGPASLLQTVHSLRRSIQGRPFAIRRINASRVISGGWEEDAALFVMPGGRDVPYHKALAGDGTRSIRAFVESGGGYLGICAGAYFGAQRVEFELGTPLEIIDKRELSFFSGSATGPALGTGSFCYDSEKGAEAARVSWKGDSLHLYYNGGCTFEGEGFEVVSRYLDHPNQPPAIISCQVGKGRVILSGVHCEYGNYSQYDESILSGRFQKLLDDEQRARSLFHEVLAHFSI